MSTSEVVEAEKDDLEKQDSNDTCCICMDDFNADNKKELVVVLPCKAHYFHELCITEWMRKQNLCPVCRHEVTIENLTEQQK